MRIGGRSSGLHWQVDTTTGGRKKARVSLKPCNLRGVFLSTEVGRTNLGTVFERPAGSGRAV